MPLHRLTSVTIGVPNVAETAAYYTEFGLSPQHDGWFGTRDGGRQLRIVHSPMRRLVEVHPDPATALSRPVRNDVVALWGLDHPARLPWPPSSFEESLFGSEWR